MDISPDAVMFLIRLFGRLGLIFLLAQLYRVYKLFSSPLLKHRNRWFIRGFILSIIISFILMFSEFLIHTDWMPIITMAFNTLTTYLIALYLSRQVTVMERNTTNAEYSVYATAMDNFILSLKKDAHKK